MGIAAFRAAIEANHRMANRLMIAEGCKVTGKEQSGSTGGPLKPGIRR
jgi:hypothetical protein